jgi:hypothetical protein
MSKQETTPWTIPSRNGWRRIGLLIGLLFVAIAAFLSRDDLGLRLGPRERTILDDPYINNEAIIQYLDGQKIQPNKAVDAAGKPTELLIVKKEQIKNLRLTSDDPNQVFFRFTLDDGPRRYDVSGEVSIFHVDEPKLHYHDYRFFTASIVREY